MKKGEWFLHGKAWGAEPSDDEGKDEEEEGVAAHQLPLQIKTADKDKDGNDIKGKKKWNNTCPGESEWRQRLSYLRHEELL